MGTWASPQMATRPADVFVGREIELGWLNQALKRAVDGSTSLVIIQGEPHVGKKELLRTFHRGLEIDHHHLVAHCDQRESAMELGVIEQIIGSGLAGTDESGVAGSLNGSDRPHAGRRVLELLEGLQEQKLVVVEICDIQWADAESISALCYALRRLRSGRLLVLASSLDFPDSLSELVDIAREDSNRIAPVEGLSIDEIRQLAATLGVGPISATSAARLREFTSGRPTSLVSLLSETPLVALANSCARLPAPRAAYGRVVAVMEHLPPDARALLEGVAVQGTEATLVSAEQVGDVADLRVAVAAAEACGLVVVDLSVGCSSIRFRDAQMASAVYQHMGSVARAAAHERAAKTDRDPQAALLHRISAAMRADSQLAAETEAAAERKVLAGDIGRGADLAIAAANLSDSGDIRERRLLRAAELLVAACEHDRASDVVSSIVDPIDEIGYRYAVGCVALGQGRLREARDHLDSARSAATSASRPRLAAKCAAHLMVLACRECRFDEAIHLLGSLGDQAPRAAGLETVTFATWSWNPQPTSAGGTTGEGMRQFSSGHDALIAGEYSAAREHLLRAVEDCSSRDADLLLPVAIGYLAWAELSLGEWDDAAEHFDEAIARLSWSAEPPPSITLFLMFSTRLHADRGQWLIAEECAGRIADIADKRPERLHRILATAAQAHIARARGDDERVVELISTTSRVLTQPVSMWDVGGVMDHFFAWANASIRVGRAGDVNVVDSPIAAGHPSNPRGALLVRHLQACVAAAGTNDAKTERLFNEAMALSDGASPFDVAHLEFSYGAHLRRRGHRRQAAALLESAIARFRSLGAVPDEERCGQELKACGRSNGEPDRDTERAILTPREASVAELVALGKSNRQVADALFVSKRTVEYHVSNVLRKLGLSSRMDVSSALSIVEGTSDHDGTNA